MGSLFQGEVDVYKRQDKKIADYLHVKEGSPLLFVQRVTKDQRDRIVEYAEFYYRGDRYRYSVQLHVPD